MDAPLPTGAQDGLGWTPFLPKRPSLSDELNFARRVYPLPEKSAADFIKRMGLEEKWHGGEHTGFRAENDPGHVFKIQENNILVGDCHPRNFRTVAGETVPIDIIITEPDGAMLKFAKANVAKA